MALAVRDPLPKFISSAFRHSYERPKATLGYFAFCNSTTMTSMGLSPTLTS